MIKPSAWNEEEIQYLKENYLKQHAREIGLALGRSYASVVNQLYKQRLSSTGRKLRPLSPHPRGTRYQKIQRCKLPAFHPVMLGIYPVTNQGGSNGLWSKRRAIILKMHDYCCVYCGDVADSVDHVIAINNGGTDDINNLVAACLSCNSGFRDRPKYIEFKISVI